MALDVLSPILQGLQGRSIIDRQEALRQQQAQQQQLQTLSQAAVTGGLGSQEFKSLAGFSPDQATKLKGLLKTDDQGLDAAFQDAAVFKNLLQSDPSGQGAIQFGMQRLQFGQDQGRNMTHTQRFLQEIQENPVNALSSISSFLEIPDRVAFGKTSKSAGQKEFESLTKDLTKEEKAEAIMIKLGLSPRAVGSAIQTISDKNISEQIGKAKATIRQREKFGELTASSRAKAIDSGFEKIVKIDAGLRNIDRAIVELNAGAGVGAIEKFLPSFRASSVALDNIQKSMALDVIGAVTFGALSQGELNLAKEVALPTGLDTPQLIKHLTERKAAQEKLRGYYQEQINFLDQGGTVAGFMRSKEREIESQPPQDQPVITQPVQNQAIQFDAQGNQI